MNGPRSSGADSSGIPISARFFEVDHLRKDLKERTVRGATVTVVSHSLRFLLHTGSTMVLARLLTPRDYGIFGMVTAVTGFVAMFKDLGLSMATVQRAKIDHNQVSTLFWVNVGLGVSIMAITAILAPLIARFYGEPRLTTVTLILAFGFVVGGLSVQHQALIKRQMRFGALAAIDITSMFFGIIAGILAARKGWEYWALVCMHLTMISSTTIMSWLVCRWRPGLPRRTSEVRSMLSFGGNLTLFNILNYFVRNLDNVLIGRYWGPSPLGLYSKAYGLLLLPLSQINQPITHVAIPALSHLQGDPERYRRFYCRAMNSIAYLTMPMIATMAVLSDEIIEIMLGSQWIDAGKIFKVLAFSGIVQSVGNLCGWIFISLGQTDRMMRWGLVVAPINIISFIIGLKWGPIGVAVCYTVVTYLLLYPSFYVTFKKSPIKTSDVWNNTWRPAVLSVLVFSVAYSVRTTMADFELLARTSLPIVSAVLTMSLFVAVWPKAKADVVGIVDLLKSVKK